MRRLIYLPLIRTAEDRGGLAGEAVEAIPDTVVVRQQRRSARQEWDQIEQLLNQLPVSECGWRVYQDGLPSCAWGRALINEFAARGSRNHGLLQQLITRGAELMECESPELLMEEYVLRRRLRQCLRLDRQAALVAVAALLSRRDAWLADRVNRTLQEGEVGILFIGLSRSVEGYLDRDIRRSYPIGRPLLFSKTLDDFPAGPLTPSPFRSRGSRAPRAALWPVAAV